VRVSAFSSLGRYGHMAEAKQVVERHVEAFNAHQADAEPWTDDAEFVAPGASMRGREEVLAFLAAFWEAFPDGRLELSRVFGRAPSPQLRGGSLARTAASSARPLPRCRPPVGSSTSAGCPLARPAGTSSLRSICTSIKWSSSPSSASCKSCQRPSTARPNRVPTEGGMCLPSLRHRRFGAAHRRSRRGRVKRPGGGQTRSHSRWAVCCLP
jgi:hypothetical protein